MSDQTVVIIGAGQGGLQAAVSLRQEGFDGKITLVGAEPGLPYQRPPLSKSYLLDGKVERLALRPQSFFDTKQVRYLHSTRAEKIDRKARLVLVSGPSGDEALPYDRLILATGARNSRPPLEGIERALDLRTLEDADGIRKALAGQHRIAIIGGGFIGLEIAAVARSLGHEVAVIEAAPRLMSRAVSEEMAQRLSDYHAMLGTSFHMGQPAAAIHESSVGLANGEEVPASFVLLAAGVVPNHELARDSGLTTGNGVIVDATLRSSDPSVFALGDCACFPDPRTRAPIRLESVQAATDHARHIAAQIVKDTSEAYSAAPWFWSDQGDQKLQIAGFAGPDTNSRILADGVIARVDRNDLIAIETINNAKIHMKARRLMGNGRTPRITELEEFVLD